jgi:threonine/homoserine efflux transporter RhtA
MSFLARLVRKIIFYDFPPWVFTALYVGFGALILVTFILVKPARSIKKAKSGRV